MENHKQLHSLSSINPSPQKNLLRGIVTSLFFVLISAHCPAQPASFHKGVNLTDWFQTSNPGQIQFTKFTKQDFFDIKSLGCDVIRLPINLLFFTDREPDYTIDPLILSFLDSVVNWSEEVQIYLILDNHSYDLSLINSSAYETSLIKMWSQLAHRYENRSEYIIFEIQNEPHDISDVLWGNIQGNVIEAIREIDKIHTIIVGPASWNSFNNLQYMPEYSDQNLIYTFHFYDPFSAGCYVFAFPDSEYFSINRVIIGIQQHKFYRIITGCGFSVIMNPGIDFKHRILIIHIQICQNLKVPDVYIRCGQ